MPDLRGRLLKVAEKETEDSAALLRQAANEIKKLQSDLDLARSGAATWMGMYSVAAQRADIAEKENKILRGKIVWPINGHHFSIIKRFEYERLLDLEKEHDRLSRETARPRRPAPAELIAINTRKEKEQSKREERARCVAIVQRVVAEMYGEAETGKAIACEIIKALEEK